MSSNNIHETSEPKKSFVESVKSDTAILKQDHYHPNDYMLKFDFGKYTQSISDHFTKQKEKYAPNWIKYVKRKTIKYRGSSLDF